MSASPAERVLSARLAAHESWARTPDRSARTAPARRGLETRFEREVDALDPEGRMSPADRAKAIESARSAYYARLALRSAQARRRKASSPAHDQEARDALEDRGLVDADVVGTD